MTRLFRTAGCAALLCFIPAAVLAQQAGGPLPARPQQPSEPTLPATPAPPQAPAQAQAQPAPCPAPGEKVEVKQKSPLAQETGAAMGGTAAQIASAAVLGPVGAAAAAVLGATAGKKVGGVVKKKEKVEASEVTPGCSQNAQAGPQAAQLQAPQPVAPAANPAQATSPAVATPQPPQ